MTKKELVSKIAKQTKLSREKVAGVVQKTLDCIADELAEAKSIELRNFGVFEIRAHKARKGRNPNKPKNEVIIPATAVVKFRPGKELKKRIDKLDPSKL